MPASGFFYFFATYSNKSLTDNNTLPGRCPSRSQQDFPACTPSAVTPLADAYTRNLYRCAGVHVPVSSRLFGYILISPCIFLHILRFDISRGSVINRRLFILTGIAVFYGFYRLDGLG